MAHSKNLRERVIEYFEHGGTVEDVCKIFRISRSSLGRWRRLKEKTGYLAPKLRIGSPYKINNILLKNYINEHPGASLSQIAKQFKVDRSSVSRALRRVAILPNKVIE